jgi:Tfp pilus assembly protein PilV
MKQFFRSPKKAGQQKGFTLIETTVAMVVMMVGGLGVAAVFVYAIKNNSGARDRAVALAVAQQQVETLRNLPFSDPALTATPTTVIPVIVSSVGRTYSVTTTIVNTTSTIKTIQIQVTPKLSDRGWASTPVQINLQRASFVLGPYYGGQ